jgi:hypothetical protein
MAFDDYTDDPTIPDDAELWRRIPPWHFVDDANLGQIRPSSAAFEDDPSGSPMSVILGGEAGDLQRALAGHEGFALVSITAALARGLGLGVARDPRPDEPAHAVVFGRKNKRISRRLAMGSRWIIPPSTP